MMSKHILIVSDAPFTCMMIANACVLSGSEVVCEAVSKSGAVESCRRFKPHTVFIDLCMFEQDNLQMLQTIQAIDSHTNIVICASWGQKPLLIEAAMRGAKDFLFQPLNQDHVQKVIQHQI